MKCVLPQKSALVGLTLVMLASQSGTGRAESADPDNAELVSLGEEVYAQHCASCHGVDLEGQANWKRRLPDGSFPAPPHDATGHTWHHGDQLLFEITKDGGQHMAPAGFKSNMPAFGDQLSDREIWAVLAFIKSRWPADVRAVQEQRSAPRG